MSLSDGRTIRYDRLVLATGAANRELRVQGSGLNRIYGLRTLDDAESLYAELDVGRRH